MTYLMWLHGNIHLTWEGGRPANDGCWYLFGEVQNNLTSSQRTVVWVLDW